MPKAKVTAKGSRPKANKMAPMSIKVPVIMRQKPKTEMPKATEMTVLSSIFGSFFMR